MSGGVMMDVKVHGLAAELTHGPSGARISTVPPVDNGGDGSSFSPTDLLAVSLGACALSTCALSAPKEALSWGDASVRVEKLMVGPPRRLGEIGLSFTMPKETKPEHRARFEQIARECPVARSLHPDVKVAMSFVWP